MFSLTNHNVKERMNHYGKIIYNYFLNGVTEDTYNKATDHIQANALRLNYRPVASTIDAEFPDDIDPAKAPELADAVIREVHQTL